MSSLQKISVEFSGSQIFKNNLEMHETLFEIMYPEGWRYYCRWILTSVGTLNMKNRCCWIRRPNRLNYEIYYIRTVQKNNFMWVYFNYLIHLSGIHSSYVEMWICGEHIAIELMLTKGRNKNNLHKINRNKIKSRCQVFVLLCFSNPKKHIFPMPHNEICWWWDVDKVWRRKVLKMLKIEVEHLLNRFIFGTITQQRVRDVILRLSSSFFSTMCSNKEASTRELLSRLFTVSVSDARKVSQIVLREIFGLHLNF